MGPLTRSAVRQCPGIAQGKDVFAVGQRHSQQGREPHPKDSARTAYTERRRHADDVSRSHSCRQGGGKGLELGEGSAVLAGGFLFQTAESAFQNGAPAPELEKAQPDGEKNTCAEQQHQ